MLVLVPESVIPVDYRGSESSKCMRGCQSKWLPRKTGVSGWRSRSGYLGKLDLGVLWGSDKAARLPLR